MTRIKKPESKKDSEQTTAENGTDTSVNSENIEETRVEDLPPVDISETVDISEDGTVSGESAPQIETTVEDCEVLYGVVMETAHGMIGTKNGKGHRELPEERRKSQGRLLHSICLKYGITIPTEFELVIFGGALIADWRYMTTNGEDSIVQTDDNSDEE